MPQRRVVLLTFVGWTLVAIYMMHYRVSPSRKAVLVALPSLSGRKSHT